MVDTVFEGVDYGPLRLLIGEWKGDAGTDVSPEPDGEELNPYYESILFEAIGDVTNAERQTLAVLRYHQVVSRKSNDEVFHNETGYLHWDAAAGVAMQSLAIPRGVSLVAGGTASVDGGRMRFEVTASYGDGDWSIAQSPFMRDNAKTVSFTHSIEVDGDRLAYSETTVLDIYGKRFDHTDTNQLARV